MKKKYKIVGISNRFTVEKKGRDPYEAQTLYLVSHDDRVTGLVAESLFVTDRVLGEYIPSLNDEVYLSYAPSYSGRAFLESIDKVEA